MDKKDTVTTKFFSLNQSQTISFQSGEKISHAQLAYQTWGKLNADKSNAILLIHAFSGSSHAAGYNSSLKQSSPHWKEELYLGWWDEFIGPQKALDTDKFFIICPNYLGSCYGSTAAHSINPKTGKAYGSKFPRLTAFDQASAFLELIDFFGIDNLASVIGPSIGGLISLTFAHLFPERVRSIIPICSGCKTTVLNRLILFEQILAIENDPNFNGGNYYDGNPPFYGLALARMISHKTFVHLDRFEDRARQEIISGGETLSWYQLSDPFQSYMLYQGKKFAKRFDANSYLNIANLWAQYDPVIEGKAGDIPNLLQRSKKHNHYYLIFSIDSDFCFYPEEQAALATHLKSANINHEFVFLTSAKGHDSFLLEPELYTTQIRSLLEQQIS